MPSAFIPNDGYTLNGKVEPIKGLFDGFAFAFRPCLADDLEDYRKQLQGKQGREVARIDAAHLAKFIKSWELVDNAGEAVPISPETLRRIAPAALAQLLNHVNGYAGSEQEETDQKN